MAVKIRLARRGRKKAAQFDIVVADSRSPRDGRFIEKIGTYNPQTNPATINFDGDKAFDWIMKGAQPTDTVRAMLSYRGVLYRKHLQLGVIKGAITQDTADQRFTEWKEQKDAKIEGKRTNIGSAKDEARKAALAAETKVKEARAEAQRQKQAAALAATAPAAEGDATETAEASAETTEEAGA
ncbi:30S ribosomal protein S16 [Hymenobacter taeanensis]|uniref:Small ribosomal subunit protein bS16 n=1 Tax=Hymenobacter taeanensis TaxID=2735321 RepID=A0A6M6BDQ0_9BACT|nr:MULTISPECIES: 30S ribosomal protein S16 [Hymenobacter]QJX45874.1 30S ribosomal protein S16 [Hymenobacter taeanensis]UOQ79719.1 30S ribosomal protein S16 [Hymenobacter sp. 5414T-23]